MKNIGQLVVEELMEELRQLDIHEDLVQEGVYDPGIMKAVFLAGGPGSGKSTVSSAIFGVPEKFNFSIHGLRSVNSDVAFESLLKKAGYGTKLASLDDETFKKITSSEPDSIRSKARTTVEHMFDLYMKGRLGVIIDGTGARTNTVRNKFQKLDSLGYDCIMVFINTSLETALARNRMRARVLPDVVVEGEWKNVQANLGHFQSMFGGNFVIIDNNSTGGVQIPRQALSVIERFVKAPVQNHIGKKWIRRELELRKSRKVYEASQVEGGTLASIRKGGDTKMRPSSPSKLIRLPEGSILEKSGDSMTLVGVYSGRFQPFGQHHFAAYKQLQAVTGNNTYIATSDVTDSKKSPFNFAEKKRIIQKYGIPGGRIVRTRNPYAPEEVLKKYDPDTTALVVIFGEKDAGRLGGKYYIPFKGARNLKGYKDNGYYIIARHESVIVGGKELSGTQIRQYLGSHKIDTAQKKKLFSAIFGWYDESLFKLITGKVGAITPANESVLSLGLLLTEGGAYGHMSHPFDDQELTFGDFKRIIELGLQGRLDRESKVMEKLDGMALSVSWVNGKLVAARNKSHLKNGGANALDVSGIKTMFNGRGDIGTAFSGAMTDLQKAIAGLSEKQREYVFDNGRNFMALEIIYPKTENVLPYGQSMLIFHGIITYDSNGNAVGENKPAARMLAGMIRQIDADVQKTFKIAAPSFISVPAHQDFSAKQDYFIGKVNRLAGKFGLKDSDTMALYHQRWWEDFIAKKARSMKYSLSNTTLTQLVKRWAFDEKSSKIIDIVKGISSPEFAEWVRSFDKESHAEQVKTNMLPFETLFLELGAEILSNASGYLAANPDKTVQTVRKKVEAAIKQLKASKDIKQLKKLKLELGRIQAIGGLDRIVPAEGLVFTYNGKTYKLTGVFASINQLLGVLKYAG